MISFLLAVSKYHLEERWLDQAQARALYTPIFGGHLGSIQGGALSAVRALQLFGRLAVVETHTLWYPPPLV